MAQDISFDVIARDKASKTFSNIAKSSHATEGSLKKFGHVAGHALGLFGLAGGTVGVIEALKGANEQAREAQKTSALTTQVIKSTGGAAKVSSEHVDELSRSISEKAGIDHLAVQSGANLLLTFKGIRNEAGKGNKIFDQAAQAVTDLGAGLAAASGGQINFRSATTLVGKALNDPIKGLTALRRVGVQFTKGQEAQIKKLVESGHRMKAQKIILRELKSEFGGAAASQATAGDKARVAWKELQEQIGKGLLPVIDDLSKRFTDDVVPAVAKFVTQMQDGKGAGGDFVDVLKNTVEVGKSVTDFFKGLPEPVKKFGVEGAIALLVLTKMNGALVLARAKFTAMAGSMATAEGRMATLRRTTGMLAGAAGMVALADSAKHADSKIGMLEATAGGAALGFSVAGPIGAGIGAGAGALFGLTQATKKSNQAFKDSLKFHKEYTDSLDAVTGAINEATRKTAFLNLTNDGSLSVSRMYGIPDKTVVDAATGNVKAIERIKKRLGRAVKAGTLDPSFKSDFLNSLHLENMAIGVQSKKIRENTVATGNYKELLHGFPKKLITRIETAGLPTTARGLADLARKMDLTPKEIKTIITSVGIPTTSAKVQHLIDQADKYAKAHPKPKFDADTTHASRKIARLIAGIAHLHDATLNVWPDTNANVAEASLPRRARGGPVTAGHPYIVGDRGPRSAWEVFVPNQSGRIEPHVASSAPGPQFVIQNVYAQDVNDLLRQMQNRSRMASTSGVRSGQR